MVNFLTIQNNVEDTILGTFDDSLDVAIEKVKYYGEDLGEEEYWTEKFWYEVRAHEGEKSIEILHLFKADRSYQRVLNGNVFVGRWYTPVKNKNRIEIELEWTDEFNHRRQDLELYELEFLGQSECFVLRKTGNQVQIGNRKYLSLFNEQSLSAYRETGFTWVDYIEELYMEGKAINRWVWWVLLGIGFAISVMVFFS